MGKGCIGTGREDGMPDGGSAHSGGGDDYGRGLGHGGRDGGTGGRGESADVGRWAAGGECRCDLRQSI